MGVGSQQQSFDDALLKQRKFWWGPIAASLTMLIFLTAVGTSVFSASEGMSLIDAMYMTIVTGE
jgi:hypothetical protein